MQDPPIVFCDFDGTITAEETFVKLVTRFSNIPHAKLSNEVAVGRRTNAEAVRALIGSIDTDDHSALTEFILEQTIRPGFGEFVETLYARKIPLVIVSGGLLPLIESRLKPYRHRLHAIHAADLSVHNGRLTVHSKFENNGEVLCKRSVLESYDPKRWMVIGDGANDHAMVRGAEKIFARDTLAQELAAAGTPHHLFQDFFEIREFFVRATL